MSTRYLALAALLRWYAIPCCAPPSRRRLPSMSWANRRRRSLFANDDVTNFAAAELQEHVRR